MDDFPRQSKDQKYFTNRHHLVHLLGQHVLYWCTPSTCCKKLFTRPSDTTRLFKGPVWSDQAIHSGVLPTHSSFRPSGEPVMRTFGQSMCMCM